MPDRARQRVYVTGIGVVSPIGNEVETAFDALCTGRTAGSILPREGERPEEDAIVAPAEFDPSPVIPRMRARLMPRAGRMAVVAGVDALQHAGWQPEEPELERLGVYLGSALGGAEYLQSEYGGWRAGSRLRPAAVPLIMSNAASAHLSMHTGAKGPVQSWAVACVSSAMALGESFRAVRDGYLERVLAGGTEAQLTRATVTAWQQLGALANAEGEPDRASRPFDSGRTGLVMGEGAAVFLLESEAAVEARGGRPLAEIVGYGAASDAHDLTAPLADGQIRTMRVALEDAGLPPDAIAYLNAHATATIQGDVVECEAIREVFGDHLGSLPVSSSKGAHGHLVGAAGAIEAAWTIEALRQQRIPPTANLESVDPDCALPLLPVEEMPAHGAEYALSNSFAFGGSNAALVFRRV